MDILKYSDSLQQLIGAKTKPEPWLHCLVNDGHFVIYVWDTRKVIENGKSNNAWGYKVSKLTKATDNHMPLVGDVDDSIRDNSEIKFWPAEQYAKSKGIHFPSDVERAHISESWSYQGGSFFGNNAWFASHANRIKTNYAKTHNFNGLVTKLIVAMTKNYGGYTGMCKGQSVPGPTFNDVIFSIDQKANALAKDIVNHIHR
jgi:hypothetical protein